MKATLNGAYELELLPHRYEQWERWNWTWEKERLDSIHKNIGTGDYILEIGGEEGDFAALFKTWGADVGIIEPTDKVWANIKQTWELNSDDKPFLTFQGFAAADNSLEQDIYINDWPRLANGEVITENGFRNINERPDIQRATVDVLSDKDIVRKPSAMSIDVEGAELIVLQGSMSVLLKYRPLVWVSVHPTFMQSMYSTDSQKLFAYMDKLNYSKELLAVDHEEHWFFFPTEQSDKVIL